MVVNAVVVTEFDKYDTIILSVDVADSVAAIFESFGIGHNPSTDRVQGRIKKTGLETVTRSWRHSEAGSVVYWLGHGRGPDPSRLLDSSSVPTRSNDGIGADDLIDDICRIGQESKFIIVILEACRSGEFVQDLKKGLRKRRNFNCATLILYSNETVTIPHDVLTELRQILDDVFGAEPEFYLANLQAEFKIKSKAMSVASESLNISDEVLRRTAPVPAGQTLDIHRRLRKVLEILNDDEREHFVSKAQSAGPGELTWNFEGRDHERQTVLTWLKDDTSPICIVRGEAGQGKSAFLGDIVTRCRSDLADALIRAGLMTRVNSWNEIGHKVLPISINASGLTTEQLVERALRDLGESRQADPEIDKLLERIEELVESLDRRVVFIIDGVDEMQDPIEGARIIGALSSRRGLKVLVACRDTPNEGQQFFAFVHADLVQSILETASVGQAVEIVLRPDPEAIERYIRRRLQSYLVDRALPERLDLPVKDFLHASVLVREIAFDPEWLDDWELLFGLVSAGLLELYDMMLSRLSAENPAFIPLFYACALSQGRGLPIAGEVWLTIARAVGGNDSEVDQKSLTDFLNSTEQYLRVDIEHDQTVYRPGHSLLRSFLLSKLTDVSSYHRLLATVCASQVGDDSSNVYYRHAATMHARRSNREGWWAIDRIAPPVWNLLDHQRVVEDAMRDLFGRTRMPSGVEDLVLSHHFTAHLGQAEPVEGWSQAVRRGTYKAPETARQGKAAWLRWARDVIQQPVFLSLPGDRGRVTAIREALLGPDESGLLVGTARGDVWLWNLASGGVVTTFKGLTGGIFAVASVSDQEHGLVVIAGDDTGQLAAWSAKSRRQLWTSPVSVHVEEDGQHADRSGPVLGVAPVDLQRVAEGAVVVTSDQLCLVRFLEGSLVATARAEGLTLGSSVASFLREDGVAMIVVSTEDKHGVVTFEVGPVASGWTLRQRDFITLPSQLKSLRHIYETPNTFQLLLSDGEVMQWTPGTRPQRSLTPDRGPITLGDVSGSTTGLIDVGVDKVSNFLRIRRIDADGKQSQVTASHGGKPTAVQVIDRLGGRGLAASGGSDRTVRVWDPYSSGSEGTRNTPFVRRVLALPAGGGKTLGVIATEGGGVQFLDGSNARVIKSWPMQSGSTSLASSTGGPGRALIAAGTSAGHVHLWKQSGLDKPQKLMFPAKFGGRVVIDVDPSGELVATASSDGLVTVWVQTHQLDQKFEEHLELSHVAEVKVLKPFEDLVVVLVLTLDRVHCLEFSLERSRWVGRESHVPHRLPRSLSFSMYAAGTRIGLLSGAADGQVHSIPRLWTPKARLSTDERAAPSSLNLRQPVTAIDAHISVGRPVVVVAGAYGRIVKACLHEHVDPRRLDLGQHIASVSAWDEENLLAAVQGGVAFLAFGEDS
jgi:WD40 repeat protein